MQSLGFKLAQVQLHRGGESGDMWVTAGCTLPSTTLDHCDIILVVNMNKNCRPLPLDYVWVIYWMIIKKLWLSWVSILREKTLIIFKIKSIHSIWKKNNVSEHCSVVKVSGRECWTTEGLSHRFALNRTPSHHKDCPSSAPLFDQLPFPTSRSTSWRSLRSRST